MNLRFPKNTSPTGNTGQIPVQQVNRTGNADPLSSNAPVSTNTASPQDQQTIQTLSFGTASSTSPLSNNVTQLRQSLEITLRQQQPPVSAALQSQLEDQLGQLDLLLKSRPELAKPQERQTFRQSLDNLSQHLRSAGLMTPLIQAQLSQLAVNAIGVIAKSNNLPLQVAQQGSRPLGLISPSHTLAGPQHAALQDAQGLFSMSYNFERYYLAWSKVPETQAAFSKSIDGNVIIER